MKETIDDLNNAYNRTINHGVSIFYISNTSANSPISGLVGFVTSYRHDNSYGVQVVYSHLGIYKRNLIGGSWSNWYEIQ